MSYDDFMMNYDDFMANYDDFMMNYDNDDEKRMRWENLCLQNYYVVVHCFVFILFVAGFVFCLLFGCFVLGIACCNFV